MVNGWYNMIQPNMEVCRCVFPVCWLVIRNSSIETHLFVDHLPSESMGFPLAYLRKKYHICVSCKLKFGIYPNIPHFQTHPISMLLYWRMYIYITYYISIFMKKSPVLWNPYPSKIAITYLLTEPMLASWFLLVTVKPMPET